MLIKSFFLIRSRFNLDRAFHLYKISKLYKYRLNKYNIIIDQVTYWVIRLHVYNRCNTLTVYSYDNNRHLKQDSNSRLMLIGKGKKYEDRRTKRL